MLKITIIGVGNIGFRHYQGCLNLKGKLSFHFIDPFVKKKIQDITKLNKNHDLFFYNNLSEYLSTNSATDILIFSTLANQRLPLLKKLNKSNFTFNKAIIEKPLAQSLSELKQISNLMKNKNVFINCNLHLWKGFNDLKNKISKNKSSIIYFVNGLNWGLGCNAVHFIHAFKFITKSKTLTMKHSCLKFSPYKNKRGSNFKEITGVLQIENEFKDKLILSNSVDNTTNHKLNQEIYSKNKKLDAIFSTEDGVLFYPKSNKKLNYPQVYVSQSLPNILNSLKTNSPLIPTLQESIYDHEVLIKILTKELKLKKIPIT